MNKILPVNTSKMKEKPNTLNNKKATCPFCKEQKQNAYDDNLMIEDNGEMYWLENKYPLLDNTYQTVVVECGNCEDSFLTYSLDYAKELFQFMFKSRQKLLRTGEYKEVLLLKNSGKLADASIFHSHSQLVGLKEQSYDKKPIIDSLTGENIYQDKNLVVNISNNPVSEFYEFNLIWKNEDNYSFVSWFQSIISYIQLFKNGKLSDYNFAYYEVDDTRVIKIIPRKPNSIYYIGFGLKQLPSDLKEISKGVQDFHNDKFSN